MNTPPVSVLPARPCRERGVSLIEVLVAIVVLSLGMLAMAGLQLSSLRTSQGAILRGQAALLATDMAERMRGNLGDARNYALSLNSSPTGGSNVRERDYSDWVARLRTLPAGTGSIAVNNANNVVTITVQWDDSRAGGATTEQYVLVTRIWN
jgi:type IV pilus assembly protein PilV